MPVDLWGDEVEPHAPHPYGDAAVAEFQACVDGDWKHWKDEDGTTIYFTYNEDNPIITAHRSSVQ